MSQTSIAAESSPYAGLTSPILPSQWLHSPLYDLVFFSSVWMIPLIIGLFGAPGRTPLLLGLAFVSYHLLLRVPHFVATVNVTVGIRENRTHYRTHWVEFIVIPSLIFAAYALILLPRFDHTFLKGLLIALSGAWGLQHVAMQNFGILNLYRQRNGTGRDRVGAKLERAITVTFAFFFFISYFLDYAVDTFHINSWALDHNWVAFVGVGALSAVYLVRIWRLRATYPISVPGLLYFAVAIAVMIPFSFYSRVDPFAYFYVVNAQHCLAYLGLVYLMGQNRAAQQGGRMRVRQFAPPLLAGSLGLMALAAGYLVFFSGHVLVIDRELLDRATQALLGFFVVHYYVESRVWKLSKAHSRQVLGPLLKNPFLARPAV